MAAQRVEIELFPLGDDKSRSKAMKKASAINGVMKVEVLRERNLLVVSGRVDSVELANSLRKIFTCANVISVRPIASDLRNAETYNFRQPAIFYNYGPQPQPQQQYNYQLPYNARPIQDLDPPMCNIM